MLTQEVNEFLSRVGPETPAGSLLRRYWHPVGIASELSDAKPKKRVRILGEDLVLFRIPDGRYGLVAEACSHRRASLYYGFVDDDGLRCAYHGWKYDLDGRCIEQPFEKDPEFKRRFATEPIRLRNWQVCSSRTLARRKRNHSCHAGIFWCERTGREKSRSTLC